MNRVGILVDLSHVNDGTMSDALHATRAPVMFSHSSARALAHHSRDVPDSILRLVPANGGIVMVNFNPAFVSEAVRVYEDSLEPRARALRAAGTDSAAIADSVKAWRARAPKATLQQRSEEHTSELQSPCNLVCRLLLEKKKKKKNKPCINKLINRGLRIRPRISLPVAQPCRYTAPRR